MNVEEYLPQVLWCSDLIKDKCYSVIHKRWIAFLSVKDLFNGNGNVISENEPLYRLEKTLILSQWMVEDYLCIEVKDWEK